MLRISVTESNGQAANLQLEGRVTGPWVQLLRNLCEQVLSRGQRLTLDLTQVLFVDGEGVSLLLRLTERQVVMTNCSPFVAEQLKGATQ